MTRFLNRIIFNLSPRLTKLWPMHDVYFTLNDSSIYSTLYSIGYRCWNPVSSECWWLIIIHYLNHRLRRLWWKLHAVLRYSIIVWIVDKKAERAPSESQLGALRIVAKPSSKTNSFSSTVFSFLSTTFDSIASSSSSSFRRRAELAKASHTRWRLTADYEY